MKKLSPTTSETTASPGLTQLRRQFAAQTAEAQAEILRTLLQQSPTRDRKEDLLQLQQCLKHTHDITDEASTELRNLLQTSFSELCTEVTAPNSAHTCMLLMQCIDYILRKKRPLITQHHVESTLGMIVTMTSPTAPLLPTMYTRHFTRGLCELFLSILLCHRPKLGNRYHLVVYVLQGLLRCLFTPYAQTQSLAQKKLQPPWLDRTSLPATTDEGELLARLLTMLCNPSPSAVARSGAELNDVTKIARDVAGQHLQPVLEEFCAMQLVGKIPPEARDGLMPGVWAVINAMTREQMRAMNEGFAGAERRDVWRAVFAEWERLGKYVGG